MRLSRRQRIEASVIAAVGTPLIEGLGGTWTWLDQGAAHVDRTLAEGRQPIYALWHGRILAGTLYLRERDIIVITSENFDGEWIAGIIRRFGFEPARGSTSRGGARALARMRRAVREGQPAAFTVDGPRGPARVVQPGVVWLAGATGNPILPFHIEASPAWTVNSWDRHQIPKPGATVAVAIGAPIDVDGHDEAALALGQSRVAQALVGLERDALVMLEQVGDRTAEEAGR